MTPEQRTKLEALAAAARPINDDDWGSERQIEAENAFFIYADSVLDVDIEDMETAKASTEEMINETLHRAELKHLTEEYDAFLKANNLPQVCALELLSELYTEEPRREELCKWVSDFNGRWEAWESWPSWRPRPEA